MEILTYRLNRQFSENYTGVAPLVADQTDANPTIYTSSNICDTMSTSGRIYKFMKWMCHLINQINNNDCQNACYWGRQKT